jgi:hypothetical protein
LSWGGQDDDMEGQSVSVGEKEDWEWGKMQWHEFINSLHFAQAAFRGKVKRKQQKAESNK